MNNLDLTKWLLKVRVALAEPDEIKRNDMLRAAERFLKGTQHSVVFRRRRNGGAGSEKNSVPDRRAEVSEGSSGIN